MKKIILSLLLCLLSSTTFAEIGPLTAQFQQKLKESGSVYIKYNDYTLTDMYGTNKKRTPSAVVTYTSDGENIYREMQTVGKYKRYGHNVWLLKGKKLYTLNMNSREGLLHTQRDKKYKVEFLNCHSLPTALGFLMPDELKSSKAKKDTILYKFKESEVENISGQEYQCEVYCSIKPSIYDIEYKLYFANKTPVIFAEGNSSMEILQISHIANEGLFYVPKGFVIYAPPGEGMAELLKKEIVLERY